MFCLEIQRSRNNDTNRASKDVMRDAEMCELNSIVSNLDKLKKNSRLVHLYYNAISVDIVTAKLNLSLQKSWEWLNPPFECEQQLGINLQENFLRNLLKTL